MTAGRLMLLAFATVAVAGAPAAFAQTVITFRCADGSAVPVAFFRGDKSAHVQLDGKALALPRRISVSGERYAKGGVSISIKGQAATLKRGGKTTACTAD